MQILFKVLGTNTFPKLVLTSPASDKYGCFPDLFSRFFCYWGITSVFMFKNLAVIYVSWGRIADIYSNRFINCINIGRYQYLYPLKNN